MSEVWKDVIGYEKYYQVSDLGNVRSKERKRWNGKGIQTQPAAMKNKCNNEKGYILTGINRKVKRVHRLVAEAFIPNPENKPQVNHINGIKTDNRVENLEWCTNAENKQHAKENGLIPKGIEHCFSRFTEEEIIKIRKEYKEKDLTYKSISEEYGVSASTIRCIIKRMSWKHI